MTIHVSSKSCRIGGRNDIQECYKEDGLYRFRSSMTERISDGGNEITCSEDGSIFRYTNEIRIRNEKFSIYITHSTYNKLVTAMINETDLLVDAVKCLSDLGFDIKLPNIDAPESSIFKGYYKDLPPGAKQEWKRLFRKKQREMEVA